MYPFGLKHKGYNSVTSSNGNSTAQKFGYNGVELEESLGLNLHEMDFRLYDPAIGRFNGIDPVTHHSQGTSVAFDNNPIYFADPSGADSQSLIDEMLAKSTGNKTTWTNNGDGTFSGSNNATATDEDHVTNDNKEELETIADDLNGIYKKAYKKTPFSVVFHRQGTKTDENGKEVKYDIYKLKGSIGFNWEQDKYTRALYAILEAKDDIVLDIVPDADGGTKFSKKGGILKDYGGGATASKNKIYLSNLLAQYSSPGSGMKWTFGGVALHELLYHISPNQDLNESVTLMRRFYNVRTWTDHNPEHPRGNNFNRKAKPVKVKKN